MKNGYAIFLKNPRNTGFFNIVFLLVYGLNSPNKGREGQRNCPS